MSKRISKESQNDIATLALNVWDKEDLYQEVINRYFISYYDEVDWKAVE